MLITNYRKSNFLKINFFFYGKGLIIFLNTCEFFQNFYQVFGNYDFKLMLT